MKDEDFKDSVITVGCLFLLAALFGLAVYLPGQKATARIESDIAVAEESIRSVPKRLAELSSLKSEIERRNSYLRKHSHLVPPRANVHSVVTHVADLAKNSKLHITRLEPQASVSYETYTAIPFRTSFTGTFYGIATFLRGLEQSRRLVHVHELKLRSDVTKASQKTKADLNFMVYIKNADYIDFSEKSTSSGKTDVDTEIRVNSLRL